jgi:hypothetical protein
MLEEHRLRVFKNRVLRKVTRGDCIMRNFMFCTSH